MFPFAFNRSFAFANCLLLFFSISFISISFFRIHSSFLSPVAVRWKLPRYLLPKIDLCNCACMCIAHSSRSLLNQIPLTKPLIPTSFGQSESNQPNHESPNSQSTRQHCGQTRNWLGLRLVGLREQLYGNTDSCCNQYASTADTRVDGHQQNTGNPRRWIMFVNFCDFIQKKGFVNDYARIEENSICVVEKWCKSINVKKVLHDICVFWGHHFNGRKHFPFLDTTICILLL